MGPKNKLNYLLAYLQFKIEELNLSKYNFFNSYALKIKIFDFSKSS